MHRNKPHTSMSMLDRVRSLAVEAAFKPSDRLTWALEHLKGGTGTLRRANINLAIPVH